MKIPVVVCNTTYAKISCADFTGIGVIELPREGSLNRTKVPISGIVKHALSQWLEVHEHAAGFVHAPTLRHQFWSAARRLAQGPHGVRIHRLRQTLQWPREHFDTVLEALRAEQEVVLEEGDAGAMSARDIHDSYHVHGRLYITLRW